jgi:hypothetical protein
VNKSFGLPESIDPNHQYVYRSGVHGIYTFWYKDVGGNYYQYTNAPVDHPDFDPYSPEAILVADQVMPHTAPQFFTAEGRKLAMAVPEEATLVPNEAYDPMNPRSVWYGYYENNDEEARYVYFDTDIRENLDLWVQYQLRVTDTGIIPLRKYANKLSESDHPKDKIISVMLMLVDQGMYSPYELTEAKVEDLEFIDMTVKLLGRKLNLDPELVGYVASIHSGRNPNEPLFVIDTKFGRHGVGPRHIYSIFSALKVSPEFLFYWHCSHIFSRIVHRLMDEKVPKEYVEERAFAELF